MKKEKSYNGELEWRKLLNWVSTSLDNVKKGFNLENGIPNLAHSFYYKASAKNEEFNHAVLDKTGSRCSQIRSNNLPNSNHLLGIGDAKLHSYVPEVYFFFKIYLNNQHNKMDIYLLKWVRAIAKAVWNEWQCEKVMRTIFLEISYGVKVWVVLRFFQNCMLKPILSSTSSEKL